MIVEGRVAEKCAPILGPSANLFMNMALLAAANGAVFLFILIWVVPVAGYNPTHNAPAPKRRAEAARDRGSCPR